MQPYRIVICYVFMIFLPNENLIAECIRGNCNDGKGIYLFRDGAKYSGFFLKSQPHGVGIVYFVDGSKYEGDFVQGDKSGIGKLIFKTGDIYTGSFESGVFSGQGKMCYRNGDIYIGSWVNGKSCGKGKYTFADGDYYMGSFLDGEFSGSGKLTRKDGSYYEGNWLRSKKHGEGISFVRGKKIRQKYYLNKLVRDISNENYELSSGQIYHEDKKIKDCTNSYCSNEKGIFKYRDGSEYEGDFLNGEANGKGVCRYANGDRYEGGWKNHAPHGNGIMYFAKGNIYDANWVEGVPVKKIIATKPKTEIIKNSDVSSFKKDSYGKTEIFALVVGVASYNHMQSLKYTDDDAYQLYAFLKSPEGGAITDENIKILIDDAATNTSIKEEIKNIVSRADPNDVIMLYMSGHGLEGAFAPSDFDGTKNQMAYSDILTMLNNSVAKYKFFITDACHSGSMLASARTPLNVSLDNFYSAYNSINGGTAILMSSKKEEVSLEYGGLRQGIFSHFLIRGLKGYANTNADKLITISELYQYVSSNVKNYTAGAQNPVIMGDYDKNMPVGMVR